MVIDPMVQYVLEAMLVGFLVLLGAGVVALWLDYRAGVFVETHICEACGYEASSADSIFCSACDNDAYQEWCALCEQAVKLPDSPYCDFCDEYLFELSGGVRIKFPPRECQLCGERFVIQEEPCTHTGEGHRV